jgi:3-hydroxyacyl-CoA dehydrogenase
LKEHESRRDRIGIDRTGPGLRFRLRGRAPRSEALEAGAARIEGYIAKALARGKLAPRDAQGARAALSTTLRIEDLAGCDYVLEAATEDLATKRKIGSAVS